MRFAAEVVEVILATPADWSARIGIFGKWGSGKSAVLRFAEHLLKERKSIVFWFNPWAVHDWNDLWETFGSRLSEALSKAGIAVDSTWLKMAKTSTAWLGSKGVGQIAKVGAAVLGKEKPVDATFALVSRWLRYDDTQIRAIQIAREARQNHGPLSGRAARHFGNFRGPRGTSPTHPAYASSQRQTHPGLKLEQPRQLALMHSLVRFCYLAAEGTFTTRDLYPQTLQALLVFILQLLPAAKRFGA
jgi:hypothetical protein